MTLGFRSDEMQDVLCIISRTPPLPPSKDAQIQTLLTASRNILHYALSHRVDIKTVPSKNLFLYQMCMFSSVVVV